MDDPFLPDYIRRAIEMQKPIEELTRQLGVDSMTQRAIRELDEQTRSMRDMQQRLVQDQDQLKRLVASLPSMQLQRLAADRRLLDEIESMDAARAAFVKSLTPTFAKKLSELYRVTPWSNIGSTALDSLQSFLASTPQLPGIDADSVARFAQQWGSEGMRQQLNALLPSRNWEIAESPDSAAVRKAIRVALTGPWSGFIYFLLATLLALYTLHDSAEMKKDLAETKKQLTEAIRKGHEETTKHISTIEQLLEHLLATQQKQQAYAERVQLVLREREALIRSEPESGAPVIARARPHRAVWLIEDDGQWIRVEYENSERQRITGRALKMRFVIQPASR